MLDGLHYLDRRSGIDNHIQRLRMLRHPILVLSRRDEAFY